MLLYPKDLQQNSIFDCYQFNNPINNDIINKIHKHVKFYPFQISQVSNEEDYKPNIREASIKWILEDSNSLWLYNLLISYIYSANNNYYKFNIDATTDPLQYSEYYGEQKGVFNWHFDLSPTYPTRKLTLILQLSSPDEYEGGELQLKKYSEKDEIYNIEKKLGKIIVFPSYLYHRVTPVTKGTRKSLVLWVGGAPFR
jgi:PKHD-type hydroxylase